MSLFIWWTWTDVQRKALYMMGSRLDYPVTYTDVQYDNISKVTPEGNPMKHK